MKFALLLSMCLLPLLPAARAGAQPPAEPFALYHYRLPNGLRVWCQPRPDSESVAGLVVVRAGSRYETTANNGVSHYVEHMLFTGTPRWKEEEIKEIIQRRGGRWNGWTGQEDTTYFAHVSAHDLDIALDWLAEIVFRSNFPADKVDKEREVIFQERWGRYGWLINTLDALGFGYDLDREVRRSLFPGSTLGLRIAGEDASLESLDRTALLDYYEQHYTPENAVLIVVGNVSPEQVLGRAQLHFGGLVQHGRPSPPDTPALPEKGPHRLIVRGPLPTNQMRLVSGARTVGRTHQDRWALEVLAEVLGDDLMEDIRYQRGLVYGVSAYNVFFNDVGYFVISTMSKQDNQAAIQQAIEEHLARASRGELSAERVTQAQAALKGRWALAMEDNVGRALWLAEWALLLPDDEPVPDYPAAIDSVTPADLARVLQTYFTPPRRYLGLHRPVVTVGSGARALGLAAGLGAGAWIARRLWRRSRGRPRP